MNFEPIHLSDARRLEQICRERWRRLEGEPAPDVAVRFYPYANLHHTIRLRGGTIRIRLSDILRPAPREVLDSITLILLYKLMGRRPPSTHRRRYAQYAAREEVRSRTRRVRRSRGRKHLTGEKGRHHDLREICDGLNRRFFDDSLEIERLSWSRRRNRRVLGHYDDAHQAIVVDRRLDHSRVPRYVVEFVVYHEMLHALFGEEFRNGRRHVHHQAFRRAERGFPDYDRAQRFIRHSLPR